MPHIFGVDVSHWQGVINWDKMKSKGVQFALIKATEGTTYKDDQFERNVAESIRVGIPWGAYHFHLPALSATGQVDNFLGSLSGKKVSCRAWGDFETSSNLTPDVVSQRSLDFLAGVHKVERAGEYTSPGYSNSWFMQAGKPDLRHAIYPQWLANYTTASYPMLTNIGQIPIIWQYTSKGDGYSYGADSQYIDLNWWMGSDEEFQDFIGAAVEPPVVEPPIEPPTITFTSLDKAHLDHLWADHVAKYPPTMKPQ